MSIDDFNSLFRLTELITSQEKLLVTYLEYGWQGSESEYLVNFEFVNGTKIPKGN